MHEILLPLFFSLSSPQLIQSHQFYFFLALSLLDSSKIPRLFIFFDAAFNLGNSFHSLHLLSFRFVFSSRVSTLSLLLSFWSLFTCYFNLALHSNCLRDEWNHSISGRYIEVIDRCHWLPGDTKCSITRHIQWHTKTVTHEYRKERQEKSNTILMDQKHTRVRDIYSYRFIYTLFVFLCHLLLSLDFLFHLISSSSNFSLSCYRANWQIKWTSIMQVFTSVFTYSLHFNLQTYMEVIFFVWINDQISSSLRDENSPSVIECSPFLIFSPQILSTSFKWTFLFSFTMPQVIYLGEIYSSRSDETLSVYRPLFHLVNKLPELIEK